MQEDILRYKTKIESFHANCKKTNRKTILKRKPYSGIGEEAAHCQKRILNMSLDFAQDETRKRFMLDT